MNPTFAQATAALVPTALLLGRFDASILSTETYSSPLSFDRRSVPRGGRHCSFMRGTQLVPLHALGPGA